MILWYVQNFMDGIYICWRYFLNFMLDLEAEKYVGVDVTNMFHEDIYDNQWVF